MALFVNVARIVAVTAPDSINRIELFIKVRADGADDYSKDARHGVPRTRSEKHRIRY